MTALLFIHNYNFSPYTITPSTMASGDITISRFIELLFSNSLLRFRMALLMTISGYLLANSRYTNYFELIIAKFKNLVVPYILISVIGLLVTFIFEITLFGFHNTTTTGMLGKSIWSFNFKDFIKYLFITPVAFQLWYIKTIFIFAILSPVIRLGLSKSPLMLFGPVFIIWMFTNYIGGGQSDRAYIFYLFGYYLRMYNIDIQKPMKGFRPLYSLYIFIAIALLRTGLAFTTLGYYFNIRYVLTILFKMNEIFGMYAAWFCFESLVRLVNTKNWYKYVSGSSFFIYAFHAPIINFLSQYLQWKNWYQVPNAHILLFTGLPVITILFLFGVDNIVKVVFPKFYLILTGGRGIEASMNTKSFTFKRESHYVNLIRFDTAA